MHVACRTIDDAFILLRKAKEAGWKRSGVMSCVESERYMVELHSTESMSLPIIDKKKLLVSEEYVKLLVDIANNKLERVWQKIKKLEKTLS